MKRTWIIAAIALLLTACVPAANVASTLLERADGATLTYLTDGIGFDAGDEAAKGVILIVVFDTLASYEAPEGASCTLEADAGLLDCRLGDVADRTVLMLSATNVNASATFRREGANAVYQVFAR